MAGRLLFRGTVDIDFGLIQQLLLVVGDGAQNLLVRGLPAGGTTASHRLIVMTVPGEITATIYGVFRIALTARAFVSAAQFLILRDGAEISVTLIGDGLALNEQLSILGFDPHDLLRDFLDLPGQFGLGCTGLVFKPFDIPLFSFFCLILLLEISYFIDDIIIFVLLLVY